MVRLLGLTRGEPAESPREVTRTIPTSEDIGESGWLIRFFDSAFFCEWIAVSYLTSMIILVLGTTCVIGCIHCHFLALRVTCFRYVI